MDEPLEGAVGSPLVHMHWQMPPIGANQPLNEEEAAQLLAKHAQVAYRFVNIFTAVLTDPTYLPLFKKLMESVSEMLRAEVMERNDAKADELRVMLEGDDDDEFWSPS